MTGYFRLVVPGSYHRERVRRASVAAVCIALLLTLSAQARATNSPPVHVDRSRCSSIDGATLDALLRVELGARLVQTRSSDSVTVEVVCDARIVDTIARFPDGSHRGRQIPTEEAQGEVGARVLALSIGELLRGEVPAARAEPEPPLDRPPPLAPTPRVRHVRLALEGHTTVLRFRAPNLLGGSLAAEYATASPLALRLDAGLSRGEQRFSLGRVDTTLATLGVHVGGRFSAERMSVSALLGYRMGFARIEGQAQNDPTRNLTQGTVQGPFSGPMLSLGASFTLSSAIALVAGLEAGLVVSPVHGEVADSENVELDGYWTRARIGLGLEL